ALDRLEPWKERAPHLLINPLWEKWGWLSKDNDLAGAEAAARRCLALSERAWGAEYVWTQIARAQLGRSLVDQKRYAEALPALEQSARVQVNTWTAADANAAFTLQALFDACTGAGVGERADYFVIQAAWAGSFVPVKLVHAALERRAALTGAALDVDTLLDRAAAGEPGAAEQLRAKVAAYAAVRVRDVSSDGAAVLAAARIWLLRDRVVNTLRAPELLRIIEPLIRDAARIGMEPGGGPATKRAWVNTAVAESLLAIGDASEAEGYARESLRIRELINGPNDLQAALAAALLARTLVEQGRFADALPLAERAWDRTRGRASSIRSFTWLWRARLGAGNAEGANALIGEVLSHQGTDQEARDPKAAADTLSDLACCIAKVGGLSDGSYALAHRCLVRSCELSPTYSSLAHLALAVARLPDRPGWASIADRFEEAAKARTAGETAYSRAEMALATALVRRRDGDTRGAWDALLEARRIMEHPRAQGYWLALLAAEVERLLE
ncbi:MAG: tetratricopeptide repeat protein, partial [Phycisphaerales bacterium]|nr:tetratricopeptide repeat protein [Phycisphaerales bacterium]